MKALGRVAAPPGVVTDTLLAPAEPAGVTQVKVVSSTTVSAVALADPTRTTVAPDRFVPVTVIVVPPASEPDDGETMATVGGAWYVKPPVRVVDPPGVVTTMSCAPAVPEGVRQVIRVAVITRLVAGCPPTVTEVAPRKFVPLIVSDVFPATGPATGETDVIVGAA